MTDEQTTTTADTTSAPDAAQAAPRPTRAARGARPAAPAAAPADDAPVTDEPTGQQRVKPTHFLIDYVDVPADGEHDAVRIPKSGIIVDQAEAERLVAAAGKADDGRNVLRRHAVG